MVDARKGGFYAGYEAIDVAPLAPEDVKKSVIAKVLLIEHAGHFVGWRWFEGGGKAIHFDGREYPLQQFCFLAGDTIYSVFAVNGEPEMCASPHLPYPFDKWKVGGDVLPENPHVKRHDREAA